MQTGLVIWMTAGQLQAIQLKYCESKNMVAYMLTKALLRSQFVKLKETLGIREIIEQV